MKISYAAMAATAFIYGFLGFGSVTVALLAAVLATIFGRYRVVDVDKTNTELAVVALVALGVLCFSSLIAPLIAHNAILMFHVNILASAATGYMTVWIVSGITRIFTARQFGK